MQSIARYGTRNLEQARGFYDQIAALLGAQRVFDIENATGYKGAQGCLFLIGTPYEGEATIGNGAQIVFDASNREVVDAVHAKALELGAKCEGKPGLRASGSYAAYFRDLDGNKLMIRQPQS